MPQILDKPLIGGFMDPPDGFKRSNMALFSTELDINTVLTMVVSWFKYFMGRA